MGSLDISDATLTMAANSSINTETNGTVTLNLDQLGSYDTASKVFTLDTDIAGIIDNAGTVQISTEFTLTEVQTQDFILSAVWDNLFERSGTITFLDLILTGLLSLRKH